MNQLSEPLVFHIEELINQYGEVEVLHALIIALERELENESVVKLLEQARNKAKEIQENQK